jgi:hypothetical protein
VDELVNEALRITGNMETKSNISGRIQSSSWRPTGKVRVSDDRAGRFVPVLGVEVRAKRWFTVHNGTTNSLGNYSCDGTFKRQADYSIKIVFKGNREPQFLSQDYGGHDDPEGSQPVE